MFLAHLWPTVDTYFTGSLQCTAFHVICSLILVNSFWRNCTQWLSLNVCPPHLPQNCLSFHMCLRCCRMLMVLVHRGCPQAARCACGACMAQCLSECWLSWLRCCLFTLLYTAEPSVSTVDQPAIVSATACRGTVGVKWLRAQSVDGRTDGKIDR